MSSLNDKAWKILTTEVEKCAKQDYVVGDAQKKIVLDRLEKLRYKGGKRATEENLSNLITDIFPNFSRKVLKKAAKANRNLFGFGLIPFGILGLAGGAGLVWIFNLPYPMIRRPVARIAPIILLPSYINMDHNYRDAIANVEQADQLVNQATSRVDLELGQEKVTLAQQNLDQLPVWFLGYEPKFYCSLFSCSWKFTFDEFEVARKQVGRMEAVIFQEINALNQLEKADQTIQESKQKYQQTTKPVEKQAIVSSWQSAIDQVVELPPATLAGRMGKTKLIAYQRDFEQVSGMVAGGERTNTRIAAAKEFAKNAADLCKNPPHSLATWEECSKLWEESVQYLKAVPLEDTGYLESQKLLAQYSKYLASINVRIKIESESVKQLEIAQRKIEALLASKSTDPNNRISQIQGIINDLTKVEKGTTAYNEAQQLLKSAQKKLAEIQK